MTQYVMNAVARRRFASYLGAAALFTFAALVGCGNDDLPSLGGGKSGAGGAHAAAGAPSHPGAPMNGGDAGVVDNGGDAGAAGGPIVGGGSGGASGGAGGNGGNGGNAGNAGGSTTGMCGNGVVEGTEECDDGNKNFGDSCSPTCTNKCEKCEKDVCGVGAETNLTYQQCFGQGGWLPGKELATGGPAAGTAKSKLCQAVVACAKRTGCAGTSDPRGTFEAKCYCGTKSGAECQAGAADGPCKEEIAGAAESRSFTDIAQKAANNAYALGVSLAILDRCDIQICGRECVEGKAKSACDQCAVGDSGVPCDVATCYYGVDGGGLCGPAVECGLRTGCAANGLAACYNEGAGPCAAEFAAAAKSTDPAAIKDAIAGNASNPLSAASYLLGCEIDNCKSACFPSNGGGAGGGGAGGGGAGGSATNGGGTGG